MVDSTGRDDVSDLEFMVQTPSWSTTQDRVDVRRSVFSFSKTRQPTLIRADVVQFPIHHDDPKEGQGVHRLLLLQLNLHLLLIKYTALDFLSD